MGFKKSVTVRAHPRRGTRGVGKHDRRVGYAPRGKPGTGIRYYVLKYDAYLHGFVGTRWDYFPSFDEAKSFAGRMGYGHYQIAKVLAIDGRPSERMKKWIYTGRPLVDSR